VRAADQAAKSKPEVLKHLDLLAGLIGESNDTWATMTPKQKGDIATEWGVLIESGAAKRLVNEMVDAAVAGTNVTFAH